VPNEVLRSGRSFKIQLTVTNWLQATHSSEHIVAKSAIALHYVTIIGADDLVVRADEDFLAKLEVSYCV